MFICSCSVLCLCFIWVSAFILKSTWFSRRSSCVFLQLDADINVRSSGRQPSSLLLHPETCWSHRVVVVVCPLLILCSVFMHVCVNESTSFQLCLFLLFCSLIFNTASYLQMCCQHRKSQPAWAAHYYSKCMNESLYCHWRSPPCNSAATVSLDSLTDMRKKSPETYAAKGNSLTGALFLIY